VGKRTTAALASVAILSVAMWAPATAQPLMSIPRDPLAPLDISVGSVPQSSGDPLAPQVEPDAAAESQSPSVTEVLSWVISTHDSGDRPFMIIDKVGARVFLFDGVGVFMGTAPALLGSTVGDESAPGVGDRELTEIKPEERTTPAGRFPAQFGIARGNEKVLWVDYAAAISLHPVVTGSRREQRIKRLKSPTPEDNRITYGCINVPRDFYAGAVAPLFLETGGIVYILPETKPLADVFAAISVRP
jgi:hypothetical protein